MLLRRASYPETSRELFWEARCTIITSHLWHNATYTVASNSDKFLLFTSFNFSLAISPHDDRCLYDKISHNIEFEVKATESAVLSETARHVGKACQEVHNTQVSFFYLCYRIFLMVENYKLYLQWTVTFATSTAGLPTPLLAVHWYWTMLSGVPGLLTFTTVSDEFCETTPDWPMRTQRISGEGMPLVLQVKKILPPSTTVTVWGNTRTAGPTENEFHWPQTLALKMVVAKENKELGHQGRESITLTCTLLKTIP